MISVNLQLARQHQSFELRERNEHKLYDAHKLNYVEIFNLFFAAFFCEGKEMVEGWMILLQEFF